MTEQALEAEEMIRSRLLSGQPISGDFIRFKLAELPKDEAAWVRRRCRSTLLGIVSQSPSYRKELGWRYGLLVYHVALDKLRQWLIARWAR